MDAILGLIMIYAWIHSTVIIFKKTKDLTQVETGVLTIGFVSLLLFIVGALA